MSKSINMNWNYFKLSGLIFSILTACFLFMSKTYAAISLDRTRIVYNGEEKSISLSVNNENNQLPYLAQTWLENDKHEKINNGPLVVTPPVQRLEAGTKSQIRITVTPNVNKLPKDRESLFYFNLREIPPRSDKENVLQIALQTQVKLFFRPEAIKAESNKTWQDKLVLYPQRDGYRIENPTPYYITIIGIGATRSEAEKGTFDTVMVAPKSELHVKTGQMKTPWLTYINDYGGRPTLQFHCEMAQCTVKDKS